ncbi:MAG: bifunctional DNA primase/polymerase [Candidatus Nealsonbacteria bacterium]|nr:bifunctional DNA primase/polymerase [Candidatus Nealsonbacteria bacterium]
MSGEPFVLADQDRVEQFAVVARGHRILRGFEIWQDAHGVVWARKRVGDHCFAVSLLGPGWTFDPYARQRRAEILAERRSLMESADADQQQQDLDRIVSALRFGPIAERVLWVIHRRVMQARRSLVRLPDRRLARLIWGPGDGACPHHWRKTLREVFEGLAWLHVAVWPEDGLPLLGRQSALVTHAADLRGSPGDGCDDDCPDRDGASHGHFLVNIGRGLLGVLEQFARPDDGSGVRTYDFKIRGKKGEGPTLASVGKTGKLVTIYLPAKLGDPAVRSKFIPSQHRLLQAILRETTRKTKTKANRSNPGEAEVLTGNVIPGIRRNRPITCSLLDPSGRYVGFNGNGKRKGLGYGLMTPGGWLVKAGYDRDALDEFFADLAVLTESLGLIAVGIYFPTSRCFDLEQLQVLAGTPAGRRVLVKTHLQIYTRSDYVRRWNEHFGWADDLAKVEALLADPPGTLVAEMKRKRITQRALARGIEADPSFIGKILRGKKRWPRKLLEKAQAWVAAREDPDDAGPRAETSGDARRPADAPGRSSSPLMPLLATVENGVGNMLDIALAYHSRGWSVVPQDPGAKQPCVRWKPFQDRPPTEDELAAWFAQWPQAGLAVVLGPVSGLLVVDVDGTEAHDVLIERLGREPLAPKAISGSRKPNRYHLFFRCPDVPTKAKATPWHAKLEFRGKGGIVIIPPSLHPSGNRYAWADGRSPDDLPLPELAGAIVAALQPPRPLPPPTPSVGNVDIEDASPSTRAFLTGAYADGPAWNDRLFRAACDLAGRGMTREAAEPLLLAGARPWDEANVEIARRSIESAFSEPREPAKY